MEDLINFQDWEFLSDSDTDSTAFEEIIHADYFDLDSNKPFAKDVSLVHPNHQLGLNKIEKGDSLLVDDSKLEVGLEGIEPRAKNFDVINSKIEVGIEEINEGDSFIADDSKMEVGSEGIRYSDVVASKDELGIEEIDKGNSFDADDSKIEVSFAGIDPKHQNSDGVSDLKDLEGESESEDEKPQELGSESSAEKSNSVGEGEKKVLVWWKLPFDILKLCVLRARPVWSIPIAAAVIGILMMGRRLYKMKHKSPRIPLKVIFDDKKATSQLLVRAARLNEATVRHVPSHLLPAGGVTPWPVVGLL